MPPKSPRSFINRGMSIVLFWVVRFVFWGPHTARGWVLDAPRDGHHRHVVFVVVVVVVRAVITDDLRSQKARAGPYVLFISVFELAVLGLSTQLTTAGENPPPVS